MKKVLYILLAALLFFASLFGGAFFINYLGIEHWARLPVFITTCVLIISSIILLTYGIFESD